MPKLEGLASAENKRLCPCDVAVKKCVFATVMTRLPTLIFSAPNMGLTPNCNTIQHKTTCSTKRCEILVS